jgi:hypothetical protein
LTPGRNSESGACGTTRHDVELVELIDGDTYNEVHRSVVDECLIEEWLGKGASKPLMYAVV